MKSGEKVIDNVPVGTSVFLDMFRKSKSPKMVRRFNGPFIISKKLDKGAVVLRLHDGTQTLANVDGLRVLKESPRYKFRISKFLGERKKLEAMIMIWILDPLLKFVTVLLVLHFRRINQRFQTT